MVKGYYVKGYTVIDPTALAFLQELDINPPKARDGLFDSFTVPQELEAIVRQNLSLFWGNPSVPSRILLKEDVTEGHRAFYGPDVWG